MQVIEKNFIQVLKRWKKPLIIITLATIVLVGIISLPVFSPPIYESSVVLFPSSTNSISSVLLNEPQSSKQDILNFGQEEQTEQMLQILNSNSLKEKTIKRYNLLEHYKLNNTSKYQNTKLHNLFKSNVKIKRTDYSAIKITVKDKDPQMAADIANGMAELVDSIYFDMQSNRASQGFLIVENAYNNLLKEIGSLNDSLSYIMSKGVNDYETQSEMINQELAKAYSLNNTNGIKALQRQLDTLAKYGSAYISLRDALEYKQEILSVVKKRYDDAKIDKDYAITQTFIVEKAYKAEKKSYPKVAFNILFVTFTVLIFSIIIILLLDQYLFVNNKNKI